MNEQAPKRILMTEPHDGHPDTEVCPGCPHDAAAMTREQATPDLRRRLGDDLPQHLYDEVVELMAEAWDKGFDAGERDVFKHEEDGYDGPCIPNPYRRLRSKVQQQPTEGEGSCPEASD